MTFKMTSNFQNHLRQRDNFKLTAQLKITNDLSFIVLVVIEKKEMLTTVPRLMHHMFEFGVEHLFTFIIGKFFFFLHPF